MIDSILTNGASLSLWFFALMGGYYSYRLVEYRYKKWIKNNI